MKTNPRIQQFEKNVNSLVESKKLFILAKAKLKVSEIKNIYFEVFNADTPYTGDTKNFIFFTYCDHYRGNSGTSTQANNLTHPHQDMDDRGYIKGVKTDLDGFCKLVHICSLDNQFHCYSVPQFRKSANQHLFIQRCDEIISSAKKELDLLVEEQKRIINAELKSITGCSLMYYPLNFC